MIFVKLTPTHFVEWNSASDSCGYLMNEEEVYSTILEIEETVLSLKTTLFPLNESLKQMAQMRAQLILTALKNNGSTDSSGCINLEWVLKYNQNGPNQEALDLPGLLIACRRT